MTLKQERIKAEEYFHTPPENLNCAQAVLKAFQKEFNIPEEKIAEFKAWGGGRAAEGVCGALFSAVYLCQQKENNAVELEFKSAMGTIYCNELKGAKKTCLDCVRLAGALVEKRLKNNAIPRP